MAQECEAARSGTSVRAYLLAVETLQLRQSGDDKFAVSVKVLHMHPTYCLIHQTSRRDTGRMQPTCISTRHPIPYHRRTVQGLPTR
jgi:hypothetical protein